MGDEGAEGDYLGILADVVDTNTYMTLATSSTDGMPWVSPVFFATAGYVDFYWVSSTDAIHSRNIEERSAVAIVIFDTHLPPGAGQAVYLAATAKSVQGEDTEMVLDVYPGPPERGGRKMSVRDLQRPSPFRLYCATVHEHSILCPRGAPKGRASAIASTGPCSLHGHAYDHRLVIEVPRS
jgi:hypothetical protein